MLCYQTIHNNIHGLSSLIFIFFFHSEQCEVIRMLQVYFTSFDLLFSYSKSKEFDFHLYVTFDSEAKEKNWICFCADRIGLRLMLEKHRNDL